MEKVTEDKKEYQKPELLEYENLNEVTANGSSGQPGYGLSRNLNQLCKPMNQGE